MTWQRSIHTAIRQLKKEELGLEKELETVQAKIKELEALARSGGNTTSPRSKSGSRRLSPQGRAAISRAAKKRWAKYRADKAKKAR